MMFGIIQYGARDRCCRRVPASALAGVLCVALVSMFAHAADEAPGEYDLKASYLYNFASFTEWPEDVGNRLTLCIYGADPFGAAIDAFEGADIDGRSFHVRRIATVDQLDDCQMVFITTDVIDNLPRVLDGTHRKPVLNIADSPAAAREGAGLNMVTENGKIGFEVNLVSLRTNGLEVNFQLLRLARKVYQ